MRVLLISHTCQSKTEGQPKAELVGRIRGVELRVLVPDRWYHYGNWRAAQLPSAGAMPASFDMEVARVRWPWVKPAGWYLHYYPTLRKTLEEFRPDIIDLWEEPWALVSAQACWLRNRVLPKARIISETEQNLDKRLPFPFERWRKYVLRNASFAVGRSSEAVAVLRDKGYEGPAEVVANAVDSQVFRRLDREACRQELGLRGFVAGYVGRLVEEKGLIDMVDALPDCHPAVNLLFVGSGPLEAELRQRALEMGLESRVRFLAQQPGDALPRVMNAMDVLILPSRTTSRWKEQFGRVIIEAHACETPVIGSDSGAIPQVVGSGGLIFRERNPAVLAVSINELQASPDRCRRFGEIGRSQVERHYTWKCVAEQMVRIYERVLDGSPNRAPNSPQTAPAGVAAHDGLDEHALDSDRMHALPAASKRKKLQ
jgi:glycosyltransferase involved in cell wall biosynthesis